MLGSVETVPSYLLLTGATGMLGSQLLAKLMQLQLPVAVLARPKTGRTPESAYQRIDALLQRFEQAYGRKLKRPVILTGDINEPGLGLSAESDAWCQLHIRRVLHSAASLSFLPASESPENEPYRTNVEGGARLVQCANRWGVSEFHYVSTAYVCGLRSGEVQEDDLNFGQSFSNDYERSKLLAETALHENFAREQLTIYRPSIVIDSSGLSPVSQDRTIYGAYSVFKTLVARLGLPAKGEWFGLLGFDSEHRKNLVEADWVAEQIVQIVDNQSLHGRNYHLTSRQGTSVAELESAFFAAVQHETAVSGQAIVTKPRTVGSKTSSPMPAVFNEQANAILSMLAAPFINIFQPYFRDDPSFSRAHLDHAMSTLGMAQEPAVGTEALYRMLQGDQESPRQPSSVSTTMTQATFTDRIGYQPLDPRRWIGVIASGTQGFDLAMNADEPQQLSWGGEACERRLYLTHENWSKLLSGTTSLERLLTSGQLLVESDSSMQDEAGWLAQVENAIGYLRENMEPGEGDLTKRPERLRSVR